MRQQAAARDATEVRDTLRQINAFWLSGRVVKMAELVHENVVMVAPGFRDRVTGARPLLESFQTFVRNARVHQFEESEVTVDVWGDVAMATFRFDMTYDFDGKRYEDAGREIWMFSRIAKRWKLTWRHQVPLARREVTA